MFASKTHADKTPCAPATQQPTSNANGCVREAFVVYRTPAAACSYGSILAIAEYMKALHRMGAACAAWTPQRFGRDREREREQGPEMRMFIDVYSMARALNIHLLTIQYMYILHMY